MIGPSATCGGSGIAESDGGNWVIAEKGRGTPEWRFEVSVAMAEANGKAVREALSYVPRNLALRYNGLPGWSDNLGLPASALEVTLTYLVVEANGGDTP